jgi:16S rRNA A1518/A1519 N6-dimethyltransferase RsmA/KsgA/DIM1 with predicted DNA glycosylase/AP lyase activity
VAFRRRPDPPPIAWPRLKQIVEAAFAHRRKRLPNSLELAGVADRKQAAAALAALDRPATTRAEELAPDEFVRLAAALP